MSKTIGLIGLIAVLLIMQTGCASYMVARHSQEQRSLRMGVNSRGEPEASVNLLSLGTLSEKPWQQIGAAVLDIGIGLAAADAVTGGGVVGWFGDGNGNGDRDSSTRITIEGDGNVINTADLARQMQDNSATTTGF